MTIQDIQQCIHELELLNVNSSDAYDEAIAAYKGIGAIPFFLLDMPPPITVFRTRSHETDNFFEQISDVALAPSTAVKYFGRCNYPSQSLFYCSDFRPTSRKRV